MTKEPSQTTLSLTGKRQALPRGKFRAAVSEGKLPTNPVPPTRGRKRPCLGALCTLTPLPTSQHPICMRQARKPKQTTMVGGSGTKARRSTGSTRSHARGREAVTRKSAFSNERQRLRCDSCQDKGRNGRDQTRPRGEEPLPIQPRWMTRSHLKSGPTVFFPVTPLLHKTTAFSLRPDTQSGNPLGEANYF